MKKLNPAPRVLHCVYAALILSQTVAATSAQQNGAKPQDELAATEKSLAERFDRLELLAGRLAELSKATQPRRAELLQQLVADSHEKNLSARFNEVVTALARDDLNEATQGQASIHADLRAMLELLLQEDRDRQLESERERIAKYLAELNKLIRQQRGIRARTAGGDSQQELREDQQRAADNAGQLSDKIEATEVAPKQSSDAQDSEGGESQDSHDDKQPQDSESSPADGEQEPTDSSQSPDSQPSDSQPSPSEGQQSQPGQAQSEQSQGQSQQGQNGQSSSTESQRQQSPSERAVEKLRQAQQRMKQAEEKLKEAMREKAVEEQEKSLRELEQAKAELEKILRQLREEEMERMLVLLEARLRKMLEMQNSVYDETIKIDKTVGRIPEHELEIACASLGRKEGLIVTEADRALVLMHEDGSSVAFPEALEQAREDMRTVAERLRSVKTNDVTQALEQDIIATLEETLAALQKALQDLRDQQAAQQQSSGGEPGEQPLVDQLAELRMIRALQTRVNRRTKFYDRIIDSDQMQETELLEALRELAKRQERIFEATRDLHQGTNR